jgi:hypothetical protein
VVNLNKEAIGKAKTELIVKFYSNSGLIGYGDAAIRVYPGSVKFSCNISSWPFESVTNNDRLFLGLSAVVKDESRLVIGDGFLDTPLFALKDGLSSRVPIDVLFDSKSSNQALLLFSFPAFSIHIYYDPVASLSSNVLSAPTSTADSSIVVYVSVGVGASALIGIVAGAIIFKRRRSSTAKTASNNLLSTSPQQTQGKSNNKSKGKFIYI